MAELRPENVEFLVLHCSAGSKYGTADAIRRYHKLSKAQGGRGWADIGYHFVIRHIGNTYEEVVEAGRPTTVQGAQAQGFNSKSLGICMVGNFDEYDPSPLQYAAAVELVAALCLSYNVPANKVLGHRETYDWLNQRRLKSCPGNRVDMDQFRLAVQERLNGGPSLLKPEWIQDVPEGDDSLI